MFVLTYPPIKLLVWEMQATRMILSLDNNTLRKRMIPQLSGQQRAPLMTIRVTQKR